MSNHYWGTVDDWMTDLEDKYLPSEFDPATGNWSQATDKDDFLLDLYTQQTAGMDPEGVISYEDFADRYSGLFQTYDPTEEELKTELYDQKVTATEEKMSMLERHGEESVARYDYAYGIDPDDEHESITEQKIRHAEENVLLNKKVERQKVINAGVELSTTRNQLLNDSLKTNLRSGNTEDLVNDLTEDFWGKMKLVRNKFEKQRVDAVHAIDNVILDAEHSLADKKFKTRTSLEEAFVTGGNKIKSAALELLQEKRDIREDFKDDTWDTMGQLAGMDALVKECDEGEVGEEGKECVNGKWQAKTAIPSCEETHGSGYVNLGSEFSPNCVHKCEMGSTQAMAACRCWEMGDCGDHNTIMTESYQNQGQDCIFDSTGNLVDCTCSYYCTDGSCSSNGGESGCPEVDTSSGFEQDEETGGEYEWTDATMEPDECEGVWDDGDCYTASIGPDGGVIFNCVGPACAIGLTLVTEMFKDNPFWEQQPGESSGENTTNNILTLIVWGKLLFVCIPENTKIDTPIGNKKIDDIRAGDIVIGYEGTPVKVLQKHEYAEKPVERFLKITFDDNSIVKLCDMHRMNNTRAKEYDIGDMVNGKIIVDIEWYGNVKTSYDLLTEDAGYRISGIPVNTMIGEMMEKTLELSEGELNGTT